MRNEIMWAILLFTTISIALVFSVGFVSSIYISKTARQAIRDTDPQGDSEAEVERGDEMERPGAKEGQQILILGDSIGFGVGDEENLGIGKRYIDLASKEGNLPPQLNNLSVPGYQVIADQLHGILP